MAVASQTAFVIRQHTSAYVSIRQHSSAYVGKACRRRLRGWRWHHKQYLYFCTSKTSKLSTGGDGAGSFARLLALNTLIPGGIRASVGDGVAEQPACLRQHPSASVSIRQRMLVPASVGDGVAEQPACLRQHTSAHVSTRQHTSAYFSIRQHKSAYVCSPACLPLEPTAGLPLEP
jgi:hypothetical protein